MQTVVCVVRDELQNMSDKYSNLTVENNALKIKLATLETTLQQKSKQINEMESQRNQTVNVLKCLVSFVF